MSVSKSRTTRRLAQVVGLGAATAVTTGMLAVTGPAAHAAPVGPLRADTTATDSNTVKYECTGPLGFLKISAEITTTNLPSDATTEAEMGNGIAFNLVLDFPVKLFGGLGLGTGGIFGALGGGFGGVGTVGGFGLGFGGEDLDTAPVTDDVDNVSSDPTLRSRARTEDFELPAPGEYEVTAPESFTFVPIAIFGIPLFTITCDVVGDDVVDEVVVDEQDSETDTEVVGGTEDDPVVEAVVTRQLGGKATGKVVAVAGNKVVGQAKLVRGQATMKLRNVGGKPVKVRYVGNKTTHPSIARVKIG